MIVLMFEIAAIPSTEYRLYKDLLSNYSKSAKPTLNPHDVVDVEFQFFLARIESLVGI